MTRKIIIILGISVVHFAIVQLVNFFGIAATGADFTGDGTLSPVASALVLIARILYFPVITLGVFSRAVFPGNLIYIPIFFNSLLWGIFVYAAYTVILKLKK